MTRVWERQIADFLRLRAAETGELANFDNLPILQSVFSNNAAPPPYANSQRELADYWKTPFQIRIVAPTNFIIRAAGPNKRFGDADDIVFDSISNDFVKP